jgi:hypothetical protein
MAKKRYVHKTVRPSDGGRLLTATAEETVGISNYVEKQNFRRDLDGEVRREGWELLSGHVEIGDSDDPQPASSVRLLHEFTDHLGAPRLVAARGGALYAFIPNTGTDYVRNSAKKDASLVVETIDGSGGITAVGIISKGYGYPAGYVTLAVTSSSGSSATLSANVVGTYIDSVGITAAGSGYAIGDVVTATIDRYDALESGLPYWDETLGGTGWRLIASGLHNLDDAVEGVRRWECVEVNGYAIFNNGYDLPLIFKSDWDEAIPLYGLRENRVASVGTIQSYDGRLVCADIVEIDTGFDIVKGNALGTYGCVYDMTEYGFGSDITTRRNQYSMMWSAYGEPWLFNQSEPCKVKKNEVKVVLTEGSDFAVEGNGATFNVGDPVFIEGAGVLGGRLSLKHSGNATVKGISGTTADIFTKTDHGLKDGQLINVVRVGTGGGPVEGANYYIELIDKDHFKLNTTHTRRAVATAVLNGTTLSFNVTDHGAGYASAPPVDLAGYTGGGSPAVPSINSVGQVTDIPDATGWSLTTDGTRQVVTIGRPPSTNVDITDTITDMIITKPDVIDQYRSVIDEAVKQISKVSISRTVPSATCSDSQYTTESTCTANSGAWLFVHSAISYKIQINNEKYELIHDPSTTTKDFEATATAETISSLFASRINDVSTEVFADSGPDGLILDAKIAGVGFDVTTETTDANGEIASAVTTANGNSGATKAEINEAYIQLYGTAVDVESETLSINNSITISAIEGPYGQIVANGALVPTPVWGTYDPVYEISITMNAGTTAETTTILSYDFSTWYNSTFSFGTYSSISTSDYPDVVGSAFVAGLAHAIMDSPTLGAQINVSVSGWDSKQPYLWYWPKTIGDTISINSINNTTISYTPPASGQDDVWENISAWASNMGSGYWYHASAGFFYWDGSSEWVYMAYDSAGSNANSAWVYVGRYDDSYYYMDGISVYKPREDLKRAIFLDAYAETETETSTLRRSVSMAGAIFPDHTLGAGYQDYQEDGTPIIKLEQIGDHLACYRENGYFFVSKTGPTATPFTFKTRYQGRNVPSFRHSILNMGGKKHIYAGYNGIFEISLAQPQPIPSVTLAAATRFWEEISEAESEYVFTTNNVLTNEHFIHLPDPTGGYLEGAGFSDNASTIAYDYKYGTVSTINAAFTAGGSFRQPSSVIQPPPNDYAEFTYIMALDMPSWTSGHNGHYLTQYGISPPIDSVDAKSIYTREVYGYASASGPWPYDSKLKYGLITFEDTFNEKDLRSYILHVADVNSSVDIEIYTAYTTGATDSEKYLFGEENDPSSAIVLSDLKNENAIPLYLRAPIFQDTIRVTGTVNAAQYTTHKITGPILSGDIHRIAFDSGLSIQVTAPNTTGVITFIEQTSALVNAINASLDSPVTAAQKGIGLFGGNIFTLTAKDPTATFTAVLTAPVNNGGSVVTNISSHASTTESSIKVIGRTFEVAGIYDRASMQMVGIGGSNVIS